MKKFFIITSDVAALALTATFFSGIVWILASIFGWAAETTARTVCIVAAIIMGVAMAGSFYSWKHGGADDDVIDADFEEYRE